MVEDMKVREGYKKTEVGVIPDDWELISMGEIFEFKNGLNKGKEYFGQGTPIVNYMDVYKNRGIIAEDINGKVTVTKNEMASHNVKKGDVFFTRTSETREEVGFSSVLLDNINNAVFSGFILRGRPKKDVLLNEYKKYCFSAEFLRREIISKATFTTRALTNGRVLSNINILIPEKQEQKLIAKALTDTDNLIHSIQNLIDKKEKIKKGTMQQLLTGKKRLDGFSGEWEKTKLGEIDLFISDGNYGELYPRPNEFIESGVPFLRANNIYKNNVVDKDLRFISNEKHQQLKSGHLKEGDILITTRGDIGNTAIVPKKFDGSNINAQICLIRINEKRKVNAMFMHYSFIGDYVQNQIETLQTGSALKQLPKGNLGKIEFKLPNIEEQKAISKILSDMDQEIETLKEKLEKYKTIKKGMMQELLTGRIRLI